tara:strand:- start:178230 stop:179333 length:1104 start_codon:yes stop_codon:yes gene_type:complete
MVQSEISLKVFKLLHSKYNNISLFDQDGKQVMTADSAVRFFIEKPNIMVYVSEDMVELNKGTEVQLTDIEDIIDSLKTLAHQNRKSFNLKVFGKSIVPKDFAQEITESKMFSSMYGKTKTSYQKVGENTVITYRHTSAVNDNAQSRMSKLREIEITSHGKKYMMPWPHVMGARAIAKHLEVGGEYSDDIAESLYEASERIRMIGQYRNFIRKKDPVEYNLATKAAKDINGQIQDFLKVGTDGEVSDIIASLQETITAGAVATGGVADRAPYSRKVSGIIRRYKTPENIIAMVSEKVKKEKKGILPKSFMFEDAGDEFDFVMKEMEESSDVFYKSVRQAIEEVWDSYDEKRRKAIVSLAKGELADKVK